VAHHTDFALRPLIAAKKHTSTAVRCQPTTAYKIASQTFSRFHSLHCKIVSHRFWNIITILPGFYALLCQKLYLGSSMALLDSGRLTSISQDIPILEPDLDRTLCHINIFGNAFPDGGSWGGVLIKFDFKGE
jgi:hypothetical protein